jgi:chromatin remodeling complex protein RSC6
MSSKTSSASGIMPVTPSSSKPATVAKKEKAAAAAPVAAAPVPVAAEPKAKKAAEPKAKKAAAAAAPAAPVVVSATPVEQAAPAAPVTPATTLEADLKSLAARLNSARELLAGLVSDVKKLDKRVHKEIKEARKRRRRSKTEEGAEGADAKPRVPSIFERPVQVTDELCAFLAKPKGTLMSRSEVTKGVNGYVKEKNLKNKHDITPDAALKKLLQIADGDSLTYFNLQRYLNRHYVKAVAPSATA